MILAWRINRSVRQGMTHCFRRVLDLPVLGSLALSAFLTAPKIAKPVLSSNVNPPPAAGVEVVRPCPVPGHSGRVPPVSGPQGPARYETVAKKLYVGNLSFNVTQDQLQEMFTPYGTVQSAQVISDRDTGRSKGFGFVEMGSDREAEAAITGMNGQMMDGRSLTVNEAKPKEPRTGGGGGYGGGGGGGYGGGGGGGGGRRY